MPPRKNYTSICFDPLQARNFVVGVGSPTFCPYFKIIYLPCQNYRKPFGICQCDNFLLRLLHRNDAKIAKICNLWTFWLVITGQNVQRLQIFAILAS